MDDVDAAFIELTVSAIDGIVSAFAKVDGIAASIAAAVEQQGHATSEIAQNVEQAAHGTQDVSSNISNVSRTASESGVAAGQVLTASSEMAQQCDQMRAFVDELLTQIRAA